MRVEKARRKRCGEHHRRPHGGQVVGGGLGEQRTGKGKKRRTAAAASNARQCNGLPVQLHSQEKQLSSRRGKKMPERAARVPTEDWRLAHPTMAYIAGR